MIEMLIAFVSFELDDGSSRSRFTPSSPSRPSALFVPEIEHFCDIVLF